MSYKKFIQLLLTTLLLIILLVTIFNYLIDPFEVFGIKHKFNEYNTSANKNPRLSVVPAFKLYKNKVDAIWIGSSKTAWDSNEKYEKSVFNANIKNLAINRCSFYESITMIKNAIQIHPEIKTVYFGIDFAMMKKQVEPADSLKPITKTYITKDELSPLLISLDTTRYSFKTFTKTFRSKPEPKVEYGQEKPFNKKIFHKFEHSIKNYYNDSYKNYEFDKQKINDLKELIKWCKFHDVNLVFYTTSMHMGERLLIDYTQNLDSFYKFKEELANIQPYYDFAVVNKYTTEKVTPEIQYFRDPVHTTSLGRIKITNKLAGLDEDFGVLITKNNVKKHNLKDNQLYIQYKTKNKDLIENIKKWSK